PKKQLSQRYSLRSSNWAWTCGGLSGAAAKAGVAAAMRMKAKNVLTDFITFILTCLIFTPELALKSFMRSTCLFALLFCSAISAPAQTPASPPPGDLEAVV